MSRRQFLKSSGSLLFLTVASSGLTACLGIDVPLEANNGLDAGAARRLPNGIRSTRAARLISAFRSQHGLGSVRASDHLNQIATGHALAMARSGKVAHKIGILDSFERRMDSAGYNARAAGENVAGGYDDLSGAMEGWKQSPGHRRNLLNPYATEIGLGVARNPTARLKTYWALILAKPI